MSDVTSTHPAEPWQALPRLSPPIELTDATLESVDGEAHALLDLPLPGAAALSLAWIEPDTGRLWRWAWHDTGTRGFYPASTVKWITGTLIIELMAKHGLSLDHVLALGEDPPAALRDLIWPMLSLSDDAAFNTLQETVGFAETYEAMRRWGCRDSIIRRHFTRPHYNASRTVRVFAPGGESVVAFEPRPSPDLPLNNAPTDPTACNGEANWFTCDDLLRCAAVTLMGPYRDLVPFEFFIGSVARTNQCFIRDGLARVTATRPHHPSFVVLNKAGWWPPDQANVDLAYIRDVARADDYLLAVYYPGSLKAAQAGVGRVSEQLIDALHAGRLRLSRQAG